MKKRIFSVFSVAFLLLSCKTRQSQSLVKENSNFDVKNVTSKITRSEFFNSDKMWLVNIYDWDNSKLNPWSIGTNASQFNAVSEIFKIDSKTTPSCPAANLQPEQRVFATQNFNVSIRGNASRGTPKSSYMIKFTSDNARFLNQNILHLLGTWNDMSGMREAIVGSLHRFMNVPAPRHTFARLCMNGKYFGLYSIVEHVDDDFFKEVLKTQSAGNMYEGGMVDNQGVGDFQHRTGGTPEEVYKDKGYKLMRDSTGSTFEDLKNFIEIVNGKNNPAQIGDLNWAKTLEQVFEVKPFIRWMAVNNLVGGWDNYYWNPNNYFILNTKGKTITNANKSPFFKWIAVDLDNSFGLQFDDTDYKNASLVDWEAIRENRKLPLVTNILKNKEYMQYYLDSIEHLLETKFNENSIYNEQKKIFNHIQTSVYMEADKPNCDQFIADPYKCAHTGRQFENNGIYENIIGKKSFTGWGSMRVDSIANFTKERFSSAKQQLKELRKKYPKSQKSNEFEKFN
jgi:spore coat protein CotH